MAITIPKTIRYKTNSFDNYKIIVPVEENNIHSLMNIDKIHKAVGGQVCIVLWFRKTSKWKNQISFEYNRFSNLPPFDNNSNGNSDGKYFCESYFPVQYIPFIIKSLQIFQKIIGKRENGYIVEELEFKKFVKEKFKEEEDSEQQKLD